jgi:hypothetical protein
MKLKTILRIGISCLIIAVVAMALLPLVAHAASTALVITQENPIIQTFYTADPAPMVYNGTLYLYADHDEDVTVNNFFTMKDWRVYSTTDMVNWTDYGPQMSLSTFSWAASDAWAGQVVPRNGKFYYYVPVTKKTGGSAIGVGVSNSPTGPFTDARGTPLIASSQIDPTVFIDDDGQAYLYWGNPGLYYVKLNQDMISYSGSIVQVTLTTAGFGTRTGDASRPTLFEEAPWLYKRNSLYYMVYAAGGIPEYIAYSTGPSATGPWTYRGVIMPTQGGSFTNHQGIIDFNGNSYFFYHNGALPGGGGYKRSIAVEKFNYNADGTFPTINMTTAGVPQIGTLNPYVTTQAETISWESGVKTEACSEGGMDVANIENGDFIKVKGVNFGSGATSFDARVASATSGGNIEIRLDDSTGGTLLGTCAVAGTGGWQTWVTKTCTVSGATGIHDLYLRFTGGSGYLFNVNWWKFTASGGSSTPTKTNTPVGPTPTKTNTPNGPTPTKTNTPTTGPSPTGTSSLTPTRTPTPGASLTPAGPTPTRTITPTAASGSCSPVTATITAPFTQDGAGTFCWQSSNLGAYINSWNLTSLTVNGVNATNLYVAAGSLPAKINGYWYVSYNSTVSWGHFEAK